MKSFHLNNNSFISSFIQRFKSTCNKFALYIIKVFFPSTIKKFEYENSILRDENSSLKERIAQIRLTETRSEDPKLITTNPNLPETLNENRKVNALIIAWNSREQYYKDKITCMAAKIKILENSGKETAKGDAEIKLRTCEIDNRKLFRLLADYYDLGPIIKRQEQIIHKLIFELPIQINFLNLLIKSFINFKDNNLIDEINTVLKTHEEAINVYNNETNIVIAAIENTKEDISLNNLAVALTNFKTIGLSINDVLDKIKNAAQILPSNECNILKAEIERLNRLLEIISSLPKLYDDEKARCIRDKTELENLMQRTRKETLSMDFLLAEYNKICGRIELLESDTKLIALAIHEQHELLYKDMHTIDQYIYQGRALLEKVERIPIDTGYIETHFNKQILDVAFELKAREIQDNPYVAPENIVDPLL